MLWRVPDSAHFRHFRHSPVERTRVVEDHVVDSATIQSQAKDFDLVTTAFLTNWDNGLSNFRPCLEWPATALSGRGCRPECQRVHIGEENDEGHLKHVLRCKTSVSLQRLHPGLRGSVLARWLPRGCCWGTCSERSQRLLGSWRPEEQTPPKETTKRSTA